MEKYARKGQKLLEHSENVAKLAENFASKSGIGEMLNYVGFLHDLGKNSQEFQKYLLEDGESVRHSIVGAKQIFEDFNDFLIGAEMAANIIASHHGSLYDNLSPEGDTVLLSKLKDKVPYRVTKITKKFCIENIKNEIITNIFKLDEGDRVFGLSMLVKYAFSCLVDADRLDAYLSESGKAYVKENPPWSELITNLSKYISKFDNLTEISEFRENISNQCEEAAMRSVGIYKLEVPTGGGKTLASLRFALNHAKKHNLERIIYVIPYLSILSQTAQALRDALGADKDVVLEHHSGFLPNEDDHNDDKDGTNYEYYKLQISRWEEPIILTTQVQFLESIFSAKGSDLRKMHNMAKAVIIFDEVQSLPVKCIHLFNGAMHFLHYVCGSTILLCTATQPLLDGDIDRPLKLSKDASIAKYNKLLPRTKIINSLKPVGHTYEELSDFILDKHKLSTLVIVNTKAAAKNIFKELNEAGKTVVHLSTNMCGIHRDEVINRVKEKLKNKQQEVICISTQLIEAGVDISFECVIREVAGLDSILQGAGRCNRHGEFGEVKNVYVVNIKDQNLSKLPDIKIGADITMKLFNEDKIDDINEYYRHYFYNRKNEMDFPTKNGGTIYQLLSDNEQGVNNFCNTKGSNVAKDNKIEMRAAIRSAAEAFYIIDKGQKNIVVNYGKAHDLLREYYMAKDFEVKKNILSKLGRFSVSVYQYQLEKLEEKGAVYLQDDIWMLANGFYDKNLGLNIDGDHEFLNS
ncbi:MAG: CRISPR-associated helicase Cas3' [Defluviitaleaceae bacterium]|nr:CRISPR-associated helicase Cas3' [Defluviitaleaceae bacterium]